MTITVGETFWVKYENELKEVIVLGFNHDELTTPNGAITKAGISFQFKNFMTDTSHVMNSNANNTNGWGGNPVGTNASDIRTYLEETEVIGKLSATLQSKIKQVKKKYLLGNDSTTVLESNDKLWLLSCSEVFSGPSMDGCAYGYAKGFEGDRYKYYAGGYGPLVKNTNNGTGLPGQWWLRSPVAGNNGGFCGVDIVGNSIYISANYGYFVSPGFSI